MWTLLVGAALARPLVAHEATRTEAGLHWTSVMTGVEGAVALSAPLAAEPRVSPGVLPRRDGEGRVVGFEGPSRFTVELDQPVSDGEVVLAAPLVDGALQRIVVEDARFEPARDAGLVLKPGRWETPDVARRDRRGLERSLGRDRGGAMWIGPAGLPAPLAGELSPPGARPAAVAVAALIFAGILGLLGVGVRALDGAVRRERNDVYIRTELRGP